MSLAGRDQRINWHPFTAGMSGAGVLPIIKGEKQYLFDEEGKRYWDACSSWWTCTHGHRHPKIIEAVEQQLKELDHVLFAGYTHPAAVKCSELLLSLLPKEQSRVFYSDNGSTAVEVALKSAIQFWQNTGKPRTKILALEGGYHGDTFGAMSVGMSSGFFEPFKDLVFEVKKIVPGSSINEEGWLSEVAALIYEPLVQGSAGMKMIPPGWQNEMLKTCRDHGVLLIADEVFTGFGRTGTMFASDQLEIKPDIFCFSKGLTGGIMPLGCTTFADRVTVAFESSDKKHMLRHGHSYTAYPLACAAAAASLELHIQKAPDAGIQRISEMIAGWRIPNSRSLGTIFAMDLELEGDYFTIDLPDTVAFFRERNILLRPLGKSLYFLPPYCSTEADLEQGIKALKEYVNSLP